MPRCGPRQGRRSPRSRAAQAEALAGSVRARRAGCARDALWQARDRRGDRRVDRRRDAAASWSRRSIRNIAPRRPRPSSMPLALHLAGMRWQPALRTLPPYHDDAAYIAALKASVEAGLAALDFAPECSSRASTACPSARWKLGDPYHASARKPRGCWPRRWARLRSKSLSSRASAAPNGSNPRPTRRWNELGKEGRSVAIFAPGFAADCLETLEELAIRGREQFLAAGGKQFAYLPASTTARRAWRCSRRLCGASWRDGFRSRALTTCLGPCAKLLRRGTGRAGLEAMS